MNIKLLVALLACLALTACKVENKEGDTVVEPTKKESSSSSTVIDKTTPSKDSSSTTTTTTKSQ